MAMAGTPRERSYSKCTGWCAGACRCQLTARRGHGVLGGLASAARRVERRHHGLDVRQRPPVVHPVRPDERLRRHDARVVRVDELGHRHRPLVVLGDVDVPLPVATTGRCASSLFGAVLRSVCPGATEPLVVEAPPVPFTTIVAPHLRQRILTILPWTFSSATLYFDWQD